MLVTALVCLGVGLRSGLGLYRPEGNGPAGSPLPAEPFGRPWREAPVLLLGLGDSITAGLGAEAGYGYFARLADNPPDEFPDMRGRCLRRVFPRLATINLAVSGSTSLQHAEGQVPCVPHQDPETLGWVVMTTGGKDLIHNYGCGPIEEGAAYGATVEQARPWAARFESRLNRMLDTIDGCFPGGCRVFPANIHDPTDGIGDLQHATAGLPPWPDALAILELYNAAVVRCADARQNVHLVDLHQAFLGHGIHCSEPWRRYYRPADPTYWFFQNLEDPNQRGHEADRRAFLHEMVRASSLVGGPAATVRR